MGAEMGGSVMTSLSSRQLERLLEHARVKLLTGSERETIEGKTYETEMQIDDKLAELREAERNGVS